MCTLGGVCALWEVCVNFGRCVCSLEGMCSLGGVQVVCVVAVSGVCVRRWLSECCDCKCVYGLWDE